MGRKLGACYSLILVPCLLTEMLSWHEGGKNLEEVGVSAIPSAYKYLQDSFSQMRIFYILG